MCAATQFGYGRMNAKYGPIPTAAEWEFLREAVASMSAESVRLALMAALKCYDPNTWRAFCYELERRYRRTIPGRDAREGAA